MTTRCHYAPDGNILVRNLKYLFLKYSSYTADTVIMVYGAGHDQSTVILLIRYKW